MAGRKRGEVTTTGVAAELATRLRALRDDSGLTLRQLATKSGFSHSALSQAESGRSIPSWDLLSAFVQACGQDPGRWRQLWEVARTHPADDQRDPAGNAEPPLEPPAASQSPGAESHASRDRFFARRQGAPARIALAAAACGAIAAAVVGVMALLPDPAGPRPAAHAQPHATAAKDGADPYDASCKADEKQLDWQPVQRAGHTPFGTIVLMYSPACQAAWGYLDGPNTTAWTTHIIAHRIPGNAASASQFNGDAAYGSWGNVLSTRTGCVYIEAYVTDGAGQSPHARTACVQP